MSERIRGSYDDALYKSTCTLLYFTLPCILFLKASFCVGGKCGRHTAVLNTSRRKTRRSCHGLTPPFGCAALRTLHGRGHWTAWTDSGSPPTVRKFTVQRKTFWYRRRVQKLALQPALVTKVSLVRVVHHRLAGCAYTFRTVSLEDYFHSQEQHQRQRQRQNHTAQAKTILVVVVKILGLSSTQRQHKSCFDGINV